MPNWIRILGLALLSQAAHAEMSVHELASRVIQATHSAESKEMTFSQALDGDLAALSTFTNIANSQASLTELLKKYTVQNIYQVTSKKDLLKMMLNWADHENWDQLHLWDPAEDSLYLANRYFIDNARGFVEQGQYSAAANYLNSRITPTVALAKKALGYFGSVETKK